jgi:hypothetical protein
MSCKNDTEYFRIMIHRKLAYALTSTGKLCKPVIHSEKIPLDDNKPRSAAAILKTFSSPTREEYSVRQHKKYELLNGYIQYMYPWSAPPLRLIIDRVWTWSEQPIHRHSDASELGYAPTVLLQRPFALPPQIEGCAGRRRVFQVTVDSWPGTDPYHD